MDSWATRRQQAAYLGEDQEMSESNTRLSSLIQKPVEALMTPLNQIVTINLGASAQAAREKARLGPFDEIAVVDNSRNREIVGLICLEKISDLPATGVFDPHVERDLPSISVHMNASVPEMLGRLAQHPTLLVRDGKRVVGLIHRSDLNKQPIRVALYAEVVELEMGLSVLVESLVDLDSWIKCLRETSQIKVLGRREVDRRSNNEISALQYLDLSDLVDIVGKKELYACIGYGSKKQWDKAAKGLVHLRNSVMHPVRYLVSDTDSVGKLLEREQRLQDLLQALRLHQSANRADV
jgi:CBS domain-containing protein